MTKQLSLPGAIAVEGDSDRKVLANWFPHLEFSAVNGKTRVRSVVKQNPKSWGVLDRDFSDDAEVEASQQGNSRLIILRRYCIENYLLEPAMISSVARLLVKHNPELQAWTDEEYVKEKLIVWAKELAIYASANSLISQWRSAIEDGFLQYFGPIPPLSRDDVLQEMTERLEQLPVGTEVKAKLDALHLQVIQDCSDLSGVHRWMNGKVLLENVLFPQVFELHNFSKTRLRDELIEAGRRHIPS